MAKTPRVYRRNYSASDTTSADINDYIGDPTASIEEIGWEAPTGYAFFEWNTSQDGSGTAYQVGETAIFGETLYAIWAELPVPYLTNDTDLTNIADAIRTKAGISEALEWPNGFISAIEAISVLYPINNLVPSLFAINKSKALEGEVVTITRIGSSANIYIVNDTTLEVLVMAIKASGRTATFNMPASSVTIRNTAS